MWFFFGELCIEEIYMWGCAGMRGFIQGCMCIYIYICTLGDGRMHEKGCFHRKIHNVCHCLKQEVY